MKDAKNKALNGAKQKPEWVIGTLASHKGKRMKVGSRAHNYYKLLEQSHEDWKKHPLEH